MKAIFYFSRPGTARQNMHIVDLVARLSDHGLHHIPIVDDGNVLVGIVTQSDLIAALYADVLSAREGGGG